MVSAIEYEAPARVRAAIAALGRTEDVSFSPSGRRLAVVAFHRNQVAVFDIDVTSPPDGRRVSCRGGVGLESSGRGQPHGVDFVDEDTLVVACRQTGVGVFT